MRSGVAAFLQCVGNCRNISFLSSVLVGQHFFDLILDPSRAPLIISENGCRALRVKRSFVKRMLAEHPFGTMKRAFNQGYLLLKGLRKFKGEVGFTMLAYNMRRVINILGIGKLMDLIKY